MQSRKRDRSGRIRSLRRYYLHGRSYRRQSKKGVVWQKVQLTLKLSVQQVTTDAKYKKGVVWQKVQLTLKLSVQQVTTDAKYKKGKPPSSWGGQKAVSLCRRVYMKSVHEGLSSFVDTTITPKD